MGDNLVRVCVRTRPVNDYERANAGIKCLHCLGNTCNVEPPGGNPGRSFTFSHCFDEGANQEEIFEESGIRKHIESALDGFASLVFAFGQTGSGKTHTMLSARGDDGVQWGSQAGIIPRAVQALFEDISHRATDSSYQPHQYVVKSAFIEVYNEQVRDLLNPKAGTLKVHWKEDTGFYASNTVVVECRSPDDALAVINEGVKNRKSSSHNLNRSEKLKQTGSSGDTLTETKNINKSLLTLGKVISTLSKIHKTKQSNKEIQDLRKHIPFRDNDTMATLRYASRATNIETKPAQRIAADPQSMLSMLKTEIDRLHTENGRLRNMLESGSATPTPAAYSPAISPAISPKRASSQPLLPSLSGSLSPASNTPVFWPSSPHMPSPSMSRSTQQQIGGSLGKQYSAPATLPTLLPNGAPAVSLNGSVNGNVNNSQTADLLRQVTYLEMLLSETTMQNSHLKAENSHLYSMCEQTKSEYTRLLHKLDNLEKVFMQTDFAQLPWSSGRILPEPPQSEAFLKKIKSLELSSQKSIDRFDYPSSAAMTPFSATPLQPATPIRQTASPLPATTPLQPAPATPQLATLLRQPATPLNPSGVPRTPQFPSQLPPTNPLHSAPSTPLRSTNSTPLYNSTPPRTPTFTASVSPTSLPRAAHPPTSAPRTSAGRLETPNSADLQDPAPPRTPLQHPAPDEETLQSTPRASTPETDTLLDED